MKNPLQRIQERVREGRLPQAMLFVGSAAETLQGAKETAYALMGPSHHKKIDLGLHPDFSLLQPEGKSASHPIESIQQLVQEASLPPFEAPVRLFVIQEAHRMLPTSSNALLKTLEELPAFAYCVLTTSESRSVLPTIRSRCQPFSFSVEIPLVSSPILEQIAKQREDYPHLLQLLTQLEEELEQEENPLLRKQKSEELIHQLFACLFKESTSRETDALFALQEQSLQALRHNLKLRVVLERLFLVVASPARACLPT